MQLRIKGQAIAFAMILAAPHAQAELKYRIQSLGSLLGGNEILSPSALNNSGGAVGLSILPRDGPNHYTGFQYENGSLRALGPVNRWSPFYSPRDVNDAGVSVGQYTDYRTRTDIPALFRDGQVIDLSPGLSGGRDGFAAAINNAGTVVGYMNRRAFIYDGTTSRPIPVGHPTQIVEAFDINDHGLVVGKTYGGNAYNFLWDGTHTTKLPVFAPTADFKPVDLDNNGAVLGMMYQRADDGNSFFTPYIYADGHYTALNGAASGSETYLDVLAMNDKGWVVGWNVGGPGTPESVLWRGGQAFNLNDLVVGGAANAGWNLIRAQDINERGQILGYGTFNGVEQAFLATPVPEGDTWALMLAGLGMVGWRLRRGAAASAARGRLGGPASA